MGSRIILPGLVDIHVHMRDPGATHKEDFYTGTSAALAGGYTRVFDMSNNPTDPTTSPEALHRKLASARSKIVCDVGFYFGTFGDNLDKFDEVRPLLRGIKLYGMTNTIGDYNIPLDMMRSIYRAWDDPNRPIMIHAESDMIKDVMKVVEETGQRTHVCHISCRDELEPILQAKEKGLPVSCGVTPHHLFLTENDVERLGVYGRMKPELKPQSDVDFLWEHFDLIDAVESDHAPHTSKEKNDGAFGVPGLETTLPLLLQAEQEGRLSRNDIIDKCVINPCKILGLDTEDDTFIEVDPIEYKISAKDLNTKNKWTPFDGTTVFGKVKNVTIRSKLVYADGKVLAKPGDGKLLT